MEKLLQGRTKLCPAVPHLPGQQAQYTQQPAGKLQPLPIDNRPWETITMDFIEELPETKNKHKGILTVVDKFSKLCHFIALPDCVDAV